MLILLKSFIKRFFKSSETKMDTNVVYVDFTKKSNLNEKNTVPSGSSKLIELNIEKVYATVVLLDGKIIKWNIAKSQHISGQFQHPNPNITIESKEFLVRTKNEYTYVFEFKAPHWISQWNYHPKFTGNTPYERPLGSLFNGKTK